MKTEDAFSIEFEITPPGGGQDEFYDDEEDESRYHSYHNICERYRKQVGLEGCTGSDADGPELKVSMVTWKDWPKVQELCRKLRDEGFWASEATGAHVHFDIRKYVSAEYEPCSYYGNGLERLTGISPAYGRFICAWVGFEESLFRICKTSHHRRLDWTNPLGSRRFLVTQGQGYESSMQFFSRFFQGSEHLSHLAVLRNVGKYSLYPVTYYGSAEVRMHNGTLNDTRLAAWIELVQTMIYGAEKYPLEFYQEVAELNEGRDLLVQYDLFKSWLKEIDPENASNIITILEREYA